MIGLGALAGSAGLGALARRGNAILPRAVAAWKVSRYSGSGLLLDITGHGHHAQLGSTAGADSNDPLFLPYTGERYVYCPGDSANNIKVTRAADTYYHTRYYLDGSSDQTTSTTSDPYFSKEGKVTRIIVRSGSHSGPVVAEFLASGVAAPFTSYTDSYGNVWTLSRSASGRKLAAVDRPLMLLGTDDYLEVPDHADLNFGAGDSFTVLVAFRTYTPTPASSHAWIGKKVGIGAASNVGWLLYNTAAGPSSVFQISDGSAGASADSGTVTAGVATVLSGRRSVSADDARAFVNGVAGVAATDATTTTLTNSEAVRIGRLSGAGTSYGDFEFISAAIFRAALSDAEIARAGQEMLQP